MSQADGMRREVLRVVSREIRVFLENVDFGGEIAKILTSVSFEVKTEIRFVPNDQSVKAQVKNKITTKEEGGPSEDVEDEATPGSPGDLGEKRQKRRRWGVLRRPEEDEGAEEGIEE